MAELVAEQGLPRESPHLEMRKVRVQREEGTGCYWDAGSLSF